MDLRLRFSLVTCVLVGCAPPKMTEPATAAPPEPVAAEAPSAASDASADASDASAGASATASAGASGDRIGSASGDGSGSASGDGSTRAAVETPPAGFVPIPAKRKQGFPGVAFTEVRAYAFDLRVSERPVCHGPLDPDGSLCSTVQTPGVVLSEAQTKLLLGLLARTSTWGSGSACFLPHHGFVFYDAGVPVAEISVCFLCDMLTAAPAIPKAKRADEGGAYGLGERGTTALRDLCRELGLPKCDAKHPNEFGGR